MNGMMSGRVTLVPTNRTWMKVRTSSQSVYQDLYDALSFKSETARFDPRVKSGAWDGVFHLLNRQGLIYVGLRSFVEEFAASHQLTVDVDLSLCHHVDPWAGTALDPADMRPVLEEVKAKTGWDAHLYQVKAWHHAVTHPRSVIVSPTGSGKSLIIYLILRSLCRRPEKHEIGLVIVPTTSLVLQMRDDFVNYGYPADQIQILKGGESKELSPKTSVLVSTWQSLALQPIEFLRKFDVCVCDEVHRAKAKSITKIVSSLSARVRIGTTGSLDDIKSNRLTIEGLFGPVVQYVSIDKLMSEGVLAELTVHSCLLHYSSTEKAAFQDSQNALRNAGKSPQAMYKHEIEFLIAHPARRSYVRNLIGSLTGNTLVLFDRVEKDGIKLFAEMQKDYPGREIYLVHGGVTAEERETIRKAVMKSDRAIVIASVATFSTGINIPNLNNAISIAPTKSVVRVLQSIGRTLRVTGSKKTADWYDVIDDLSTGSFVNFAMRHAFARNHIYKREKFSIVRTDVKMEEIVDEPMMELMV